MEGTDDSSALDRDILYGPHRIHNMVKQLDRQGSELFCELCMRMRCIQSAVEWVGLQTGQDDAA